MMGTATFRRTPTTDNGFCRPAPDRRDAWANGRWLRERTAGWVCTWEQYLAEADDEQIGPLLRRHENTGRPLGDRAFVGRVGAILGRNLLPRKRGRPKKDKE